MIKKLTITSILAVMLGVTGAVIAQESIEVKPGLTYAHTTIAFK